MMVSERYLNKEVLYDLFKGDLAMLVKESGFVQDWIREGMEKGLEKGLEKGKAEGELKALQDAVLEVLEERFEFVGADIEKALREINTSIVLRRLHKKSIKVGSLDEFREVLKKAQEVQ